MSSYSKNKIKKTHVPSVKRHIQAPHTPKINMNFQSIFGNICVLQSSARFGLFRTFQCTRLFRIHACDTFAFAHMYISRQQQTQTTFTKFIWRKQTTTIIGRSVILLAVFCVVVLKCKKTEAKTAMFPFIEGYAAFCRCCCIVHVSSTIQILLLVARRRFIEMPIVILQLCIQYA